MKKFYLAFVFSLFSIFINAQEPFITTWEVTAGDLSISIPTSGTGYNYTIDFGDGTVLENVTENSTHEYSTPGVYTVSITGDFPRIYFSNSYILNSLKLKSIEQWGDIEWNTMYNAFNDCRNLVINATDAPDLSQVTNLSRMFIGARSLNPNINNWDVSNVTNMEAMFSGTWSFNQPLNEWDVSSVTNMQSMFNGAKSFNQPLNDWDVSNVTNMGQMFGNAESFDQPLNNWNVSNVTNMQSMFNLAKSFNQPLNDWDVSNVMQMSSLFQSAQSFNQPLNNWDISNITDMGGMFRGAWSFNQPLNNWDVSNVTNMNYMFTEALSYNQPLNDWDVSNVTNMLEMFSGATIFNQPLNNWEVSNVIQLTDMFSNAVYFNQDLSNWDFNINASFDNTIFERGFIFNSGLDSVNYTALLERFATLGLQDKSLFARGMFYCDPSVRNTLINSLNWNIIEDNHLVDCNPVISPDAFVTIWDVSGFPHNISIPTSGSGYNYNIDFGDGTVLTNVTGSITHTYTQPGSYYVSISGDFPQIYFNDTGDKSKILEVVQWGNIQWQSMENAFKGCNNLRIYATDTPDLTQVTNMSSMFEKASSLNQNINNWNVSNITNMNKLFHKATIYNMPLNNWDVSSVTNMSAMFSEAYEFNKPLNNWDVSSVTDMSLMFYKFFSSNSHLFFNQNINNWDVSNVTDMSGMFAASTTFNQPLGDWDVSNVTDMSIMFSGVYDFNQPLNNWDVSSVTDMEYMFAEARAFNQPLNDWDVSSVTNMHYMFTEAREFNQSLNDWNVSNVTNMNKMFFDTESFNQPLNNWDVSNLTSMDSMFEEAIAFNQSINDWDVSNVTSMRMMFYKAISFNQPLDNWDVTNVTNMIRMFGDAEMFNQDISSWNFNPSVELHNAYYGIRFLNGTSMDIPKYDALLARFAQLGLQNKKLGALGLNYCNQGVRNYLIDTLEWEIIGDVLSTECNAIIGTILFDQNNNGCQTDDIVVEGIMINANDGLYDFTTFSGSEGYNLAITGSSFTVSLTNVPDYFTVSPESATITFSGSNTEELDFCLTANQAVNDLNITLLAIEEARPGFESDYQLVVRNVGTETLSDVVATLNYDNVMQTYTMASPEPTTTTANSLSFDLGTVQPFETRYMDITMQTFPPPTVNGDDILNFTATVTPDAGDYTLEDNTYEMEQVVVNSFDPNDKQVMQGAEVHIDDADQYLDYLIRFQNTGTASAINVRILDTLHPKLDWSTLIPISASHDYVVQITDGNQVEFIFDDINLPHEGANEPESHGFVAYKIKPKSNVQVGDVISGDAGIYFDFNAPIITNMVFTEIVDNLDVTDINEPANGVLIYPNPTSQLLHLYIPEGIQIEGATIYDLQGKDVQQLQGTETVLDVEKLSPGLYFLEITTNEGTINRRFVKR
tara:strand:- start:176803 stop:181008 length:4206 start_codon:yes stop_codon:yes gene_type:complete